MYHLSHGVQRRSRCYWQDHPCRGKAREFTARCPGHADRGVHIEAASHSTEKGKQPHNLRMCGEADNTRPQRVRAPLRPGTPRQSRWWVRPPSVHQRRHIRRRSAAQSAPDGGQGEGPPASEAMTYRASTEKPQHWATTCHQDANWSPRPHISALRLQPPGPNLDFPYTR